jgi:Skp family chaperone for outer membrane proteins
MKIFLVASSIVLLATVFSMTARGQAPAARGATQIGYISAQRITTESTEGKAGVARLQAMQQQLTAELRTKQQALDSTAQQLAQASDVAARGRLQEQVVQQRTDLERATAQAQTALQTLQRELQVALQARLKSVLDETLKDQNFQMILNADTSVVWAAPGLDMTTAVLERLNATAAPPAPKH